MIKTTLKNVAIALLVLTVVITALTVADTFRDEDVSATGSYLKVYVVDLENKPVHNVTVEVDGQSYFTDNKGLSPAILLANPTNTYDGSITDWHTVNVLLKGKGYTDTVVFNCVVPDGQTRRLTVKIYPVDSGALPYVCYVESPPDGYVKNILSK